MNKDLILLHEEALRLSHPVFKAAPPATKAIYIWDDEYLKNKNYSLKRLIFIYETLCELQIEIIKGKAIDVITKLAPSLIYMPNSYNPEIIAIAQSLKTFTEVKLVDDEIFVNLKNSSDLKRYFKYWNKAQKLAFMVNGGKNA